MRRSIWFFGALISVGISTSANAVEADVGGVAQGLQSWLDQTSRLECRFEQSLVSSAFGTSVRETGRIFLERPGRLRWDYLDPERKIALLLGERTLLYLEEDRQAIRGRLSRDQALFPRLLAGGDRLLETFNVSLVATPAVGGRGSYRLRLVAREEQSGLAVVTLTLRATDFAIEEAEVLDESGNRTIYRLTHLRRNGRLPGGIFAFEPPEGTDVITQE